MRWLGIGRLRRHHTDTIDLSGLTAMESFSHEREVLMHVALAVRRTRTIPVRICGTCNHTRKYSRAVRARQRDVFLLSQSVNSGWACNFRHIRLGSEKFFSNVAPRSDRGNLGLQLNVIRLSTLPRDEQDEEP